MSKPIAEIVKSSLGPRGMEKMLVDSLGYVTITNDGATMLKEMDIEHPVAKMMVEIAKSVDKEVGDGTKSVVVLANALLEKAEELVDKGVHPRIIVDGYWKAYTKAIEILNKIAQRINPDDINALIKIASTSMQSKLVLEDCSYLSEFAVDAILRVSEKTGDKYKVDKDDVKIEKRAGGSINDTKLILGIVLDKEVVNAGMPKRVENTKIALLDTPLDIRKAELRRTEFSAKINIESPEEMKNFLKGEDRILRMMVDKITGVGANVVICQKGMDDTIGYYLAQAGILAVRRVTYPDMIRLSKATGGAVVLDIEDLKDKDLGSAALVEERNVGGRNIVFVEGCKNPRSLTILVRGGSELIVEEVERSIQDSLMVLSDVLQKPAIVAGGGATEVYVASKLKQWANRISGREQLAVQKFAEALETIPLILAENAGLDTIDTLTELRAKQRHEGRWVGVDAMARKVTDMMKKGVIEPLLVKEQIIKSAAEASSIILQIDQVIAKPQNKEQPKKLKGIDLTEKSNG